MNVFDFCLRVVCEAPPRLDRVTLQIRTSSHHSVSQSPVSRLCSITK